MNREDFMREAIRLALNNDAIEGGPFGAVIVYQDKIIGRGQNRVIRDTDPSAHAEIVAIREACQERKSYHLSGCELYTSCEPCPMCMAAAYWAHIDRVYYAGTQQDAARAGFDDAFLYEELTKPVAKRKLPMARLLDKEANAPFQMWQNTPYKKIY